MVFWRKQPMLKGYVSEIDRFLQELDQKPETRGSLARQLEEAKDIMIKKIRDQEDFQHGK